MLINALLERELLYSARDPLWDDIASNPRLAGGSTHRRLML